jgi:hypothetical protein
MYNRYFTEDTAAAGGETAAGAEGLRRGQFTFYASFFRAIDNLPRSRQLETYRAVIDYALNGTEPTLNGCPAVVFAALRPTLETGRGKAENRLSYLQRKQEEKGIEKGIGIG